MQWAISQRLAVANTTKAKGFEAQWTYQRGNSQRQIDYFLMDQSQLDRLMNTQACEDITLGEDHRAVFLEIAVGTGKKKDEKRKTQIQHISFKGWQPGEANEYANKLDQRLAENTRDVESKFLEKSIEDKCTEIEEIMKAVGEERRRKKRRTL